MDRRNEKTSRLIMNTFMDLLKEKGFEKITVSDISERADINRGTVYLHYTAARMRLLSFRMTHFSISFGILRTTSRYTGFSTETINQEYSERSSAL